MLSTCSGECVEQPGCSDAVGGEVGKDIGGSAGIGCWSPLPRLMLFITGGGGGGGGCSSCDSVVGAVGVDNGDSCGSRGLPSRG